ncbi:MAG: 4-(cytidine 5'-diphospho)-2-C-methyl-D-erythritol kinase [Ruminococcus sp.]|nr:4-(cytidine 5'-diphospho)-2-C-methyl-D-erythritol kinase [Candidatus Apopatosoma intestinale]
MKKTLHIPAKINLYLDIVGRMANGYHELETVMQSVDLADTVTVSAEKGTGRIALSVEGEALGSLPAEKNTAYRAAERFRATVPTAHAVWDETLSLSDCDLFLTVQKGIPSESGLGGASADAAAVLLLLSEMFSPALSRAELEAIGAGIGADVPFCLHGGTVLARGIGERMTDLSPLPELPVLIAVPNGEKISTAEAFAAWDRKPVRNESRLTDFLLALSEDVSSADRHGFNVFESLLPDGSCVPALLSAFRETGALFARMSGSGPSVFGIFRSEEDRKKAEARLSGLATLYPCRLQKR